MITSTDYPDTSDGAMICDNPKLASYSTANDGCADVESSSSACPNVHCNSLVSDVTKASLDVQSGFCTINDVESLMPVLSDSELQCSDNSGCNIDGLANAGCCISAVSQNCTESGTLVGENCAQQLNSEPRCTSSSISHCANQHLGNTDFLSAERSLRLDDDVPIAPGTEDELLAELESEFISVECPALEQSIPISGVDSCNLVPSTDASELMQLQRRQQALECRLQSTLEARRNLERENMRLEQKLQAASAALDSANSTSETLKTELEMVIEQQRSELNELRDRLKLQFEVHEQEVSDLHAEHLAKIDQMSATCKDHLHEKEMMVMKYAQAEHSNCEMMEKLQRAEKKIQDWTKERDVALVKWKTMKDDKAKLSEMCDSKTSEITSLKREVDKLRELVSSNEIKVKWNQNKLKTEQDSHKETKSKMERTEKILSDTRKDIILTWEQLRGMYLLFQNSESVNSALQSKLEECKTANPEDACTMMRKDMNTLSYKLKEILEELRTFKDKVRCLEFERLSQEEILTSMRESLENQQSDNGDLRNRVVQLEETETLFQESSAKLAAVTVQLQETERAERELAKEMEKLMRREEEQREFLSRLSESNGCLQAENTRLSAQIETLTSELQSMTDKYETLSSAKILQDQELANVMASGKEQVDQLQKQLAEEQQNADNAKQRLGDVEDEIKTLRRRHANNVKDLLRQLQQATRRMENSTPTVNGGGTVDSLSLGSLGSHGGSCGSLDTAGLSVASNADHQTREDNLSPSLRSVHAEDSRSPLVEEIETLRRLLVRRNEKIEFLKDHIDQLVEELHRKSRIIQGYVIREEAGSLAPESSDRNKLHLMKKGGIMASLYSSQTLDGAMTLSLSLEINNKLQALLEDTLLKNINLKEGMDTLGKEIEWLMHENTRLKQEAKRPISESEQLIDISDVRS